LFVRTAERVDRVLPNWVDECFHYNDELKKAYICAARCVWRCLDGAEKVVGVFVVVSVQMYAVMYIPNDMVNEIDLVIHTVVQNLPNQVPVRASLDDLRFDPPISVVGAWQSQLVGQAMALQVGSATAWCVST
jgi:hypothetical protein